MRKSSNLCLFGGALLACSLVSCSSKSDKGAPGGPGGNCFQIPVVDHVRFYPAAGQAAGMLGGKFVGSNTSTTDGFVDLVSITTAPPEGQWTEIALPMPKAYRFIKYYAAAGNLGDVAEIEMYAGATKVDGKPFGTTSGPGSVHTAPSAFDGDTSTYFEGAVVNDQYVGLDLAGDHVVAAPTISPPGGQFDTATEVTISTDTAGATILYSTNGMDPHMGVPYTAPFKIYGNGTIQAIATENCMIDSPVSSSVFSIGSSNPNMQSAFAMGNSLTGPIIQELPTVVGYQMMYSLDFHNCVTSGVDVAQFWNDPPPGCAPFGVNPLPMPADGSNADPKKALADPTILPPIDNLVVQPFAAVTCTPYSDDTHVGDGQYAYDFYNLAKTKNNPNVRLWVYATWAAPTAQNWSMVDCFANGGMGTPPWPAPGTTLPPVTDWESATMNHLAFHEAVRDEVDKLNGVDPSDPSTPGQHALIIPFGLALINLKHAAEAGMVHDLTGDTFFTTLWGSNGTDLHVNFVGGYFDALVFYACFFKASPEGLPVDSTLGITQDEANDFERIAWQTVTAYKWSGLN